MQPYVCKAVINSVLGSILVGKSSPIDIGLSVRNDSKYVESFIRGSEILMSLFKIGKDLVSKCCDLAS
jgi:hypothetical protein